MSVGSAARVAHLRVGGKAVLHPRVGTFLTITYEPLQITRGTRECYQGVLERGENGSDAGAHLGPALITLAKVGKNFAMVTTAPGPAKQQKSTQAEELGEPRDERREKGKEKRRRAFGGGTRAPECGAR